MSTTQISGLGSIASAEGMVSDTEALTGQKTLARLLRAQGNAGCTGKPPHLGRAGTNFRGEV